MPAQSQIEKNATQNKKNNYFLRFTSFVSVVCINWEFHLRIRKDPVKTFQKGGCFVLLFHNLPVS